MALLQQAADDRDPLCLARRPDSAFVQKLQPAIQLPDPYAAQRNPAELPELLHDGRVGPDRGRRAPTGAQVQRYLGVILAAAIRQRGKFSAQLHPSSPR